MKNKKLVGLALTCILSTTPLMAMASTPNNTFDNLKASLEIGEGLSQDGTAKENGSENATLKGLTDIGEGLSQDDTAKDNDDENATLEGLADISESLSNDDTDKGSNK